MAAERTDTERLDAIKRHGWEVFRSDEDDNGWALFVTDRNWINAPTLREAIDAAMAMLADKEDA